MSVDRAAGAASAMEQLQTALEEAEVLTRPAALSAAAIDRIAALAYRAHAELTADRTHP